MNDEWMSVPEAAEALGCTDVWVLKLIDRKELEAFRLNGRAWAVQRRSVEKNVDEYMTRDPKLSGRKRSKMG